MNLFHQLNVWLLKDSRRIFICIDKIHTYQSDYKMTQESRPNGGKKGSRKIKLADSFKRTEGGKYAFGTFY